MYFEFKYFFWPVFAFLKILNTKCFSLSQSLETKKSRKAKKSKV